MILQITLLHKIVFPSRILLETSSTSPNMNDPGVPEYAQVKKIRNKSTSEVIPAETSCHGSSTDIPTHACAVEESRSMFTEEASVKDPADSFEHVYATLEAPDPSIHVQDEVTVTIEMCGSSTHTSSPMHTLKLSADAVVQEA